MPVARTWIIGATAVFSALPGVATMIEGLIAPPEHKMLFGGAATALGVLTVMGVGLQREKLRKASRARLAAFAALMALLSLACVVGYLQIHATTVIQVEGAANSRGKATTTRYYLPLFPKKGGVIDRKLTAPAIRGDRTKLVKQSAASVRQWTRQEPMWRTTLLFLIAHVGMVVFITAAFAVMAFGYRDDKPTPDG